MADEFDARDPETEAAKLARLGRRAAIIGLCCFGLFSFIALVHVERARALNRDPALERHLGVTFLLAAIPALVLLAAVLLFFLSFVWLALVAPEAAREFAPFYVVMLAVVVGVVFLMRALLRD